MKGEELPPEVTELIDRNADFAARIRVTDKECRYYTGRLTPAMQRAKADYADMLTKEGIAGGIIRLSSGLARFLNEMPGQEVWRPPSPIKRSH